MPENLDEELGFAVPHDVPVPYMYRTRTYYQALGYERPYRWAQYVDVPFVPLKKPLSKCRVALITTAAPYQPDKGDQGPWSAYNSAAKFYRIYSRPVDPVPDLRISHVGIDRVHTSQEDNRSWLPVAQLQRLQNEGRIAELNHRLFGAPTNRSHKATLEQDCPEMLDLLRHDEVDVAVLAANCPICHQSISLHARNLEAHGIVTVVMGCAKDIVEHCGVPRFLFSDFPLGNPAGRPGDVESQARTMEMAFEVLESATGPRTTRQSPIRWSENPDWKLDYSNVDRIAPHELERRRQEFLRQKEIAHAKRAEDLKNTQAAE
ncbi:MAG: glycine/betaine/sarcosine/D-proline family reductase selenoprotein B [Alphaproteobacteria bacterium]|nr:glycine/betaine/sarcosine/D-proline family reductase selenoprotein B [Alphaproteobacteria bacterium]